MKRPNLAMLVLDPDARNFPAFYSALEKLGKVYVHPTLDQLLGDQENHQERVLLLDVMALQQSPTALVAQIVERRGHERIGLITDRDAEDYIFDLRRWGLLQVAVKREPLHAFEVEVFVDCVCDASNGFGLSRYLANTIEMYNISVSSLQEKNGAVERVINHFATANFEVHDLYDVRLILEESLNNSFYHAFKTSTGAEKYNINTFKALEAGEKVRIEFGSNATTAGFTVTDNAGSLHVRTVLGKLERQFNREGLFDLSGRGLYLSRMLSTSHVINIEHNTRTQVIALFDGRRRSGRPKPLTINYVGPDDFAEWRLDGELD